MEQSLGEPREVQAGGTWVLGCSCQLGAPAGGLLALGKSRCEGDDV